MIDMANMNRQSFIVDASLLLELGERLIGRPAIALAELVKNSFDADASICRIEIHDDEIVITDNGDGMSKDEFLQHWMRLGTTHKVDERTSKRFGRAMTGSKGIGRLSVQFLADEMILESTSADDRGRTLYALVDWRDAVRGQELQTVNVLWDLLLEPRSYPGESSSGTRISLRRLKTEWSAKALEELGREVWVLRSPFKRAPRHTGRPGPLEFEIDIEAPGIAGAREALDKVLAALFSNWKARIKGALDTGRSGGTANVTVEFKADYPEGSERARTFREVVELPSRGTGRKLVDRASFEILVFKTEGRQPGGISVADLRKYLAEYGNVSVYDAGFRLPYYGNGRDATGQDWLAIAVDQGRRLSSSELLPEHLRVQDPYMQDLPAPGRIFGGVDIDTNHERRVAQKARARSGEWLQIQPGRDRLHDNQSFAQLRDLVRFSLDLYANRYRLRALQAAEKDLDTESPSQKYERVLRVLDRNESKIPTDVFRVIKREVGQARRASAVEEKTQDRRAALLAPLAAAGMAALALNHEISREVRFLERVATSLRGLARAHSIPELDKIAEEFAEAKQRLDSLQELFAPLLSEADKAVTDRLLVLAVVRQVIRSMSILMPGVTFGLTGIPPDLRLPLGSLVEWNALLQNVLSNAWNAMLDGKRTEVDFRGGRDGRGREWLRISDTGQGLSVPLSEASRLFEPFERRLVVSADKRSIAIGGQGLGLAIVRMIARRRSTSVAFVSPEPGFSTTFELSWRGAKT